ncbi:DsbA family oxidoreductase [Streptosporangium roseum]|uniref:DsbA family oxidoreductase n=1 Tax=Streptosporangium roseum TaxID=2001 RepID=UPI00332ACE86
MRQDLGLSAGPAAEGAASLTAFTTGLGLTYRLDRARPVNSFDAHRLLQAAAGHGLADQVRERLMRAYTGEGAHLADHTTLVALVAEAGFPVDIARSLLRGDNYAEAVRADEAAARRHGVTGVPSAVIAGQRRIAGAQPAHVLLRELRLAWHSATR